MTEPTTATLDVREMTPRERHPAIFARLVNDHDPAPLRYQFLAEHPDLFAWEPEQEGPEEWVIRIQKRAQEM